MKHNLMDNNITLDDNRKVINFLKKNPRLTNGKQVELFEKEWSKWLGVKYSVFVNSGSAANLASMTYLKTKFKDGEIIVPTITWVSDILSVYFNNFKPVFVDIKKNNLALDEKFIEKAINKKTRAIFLTHVLGLNGLSKKILDIVKKNNIFLIEDVCESHGATFNNKKLGTYGHISNFSFYYAHHMSTIEGGMVCTNDRKIYEVIRTIRGHGLIRESKNEKYKKKIVNKNKKLNKEFLFANPGFNLRSTEINAVYGLNQIKRLDKNNKKRTNNFLYFLSKLNKEKYYTNFDIIGSCNYAFIIVFNQKYQNLIFRKKFENKLSKNSIEFRRGLSGGGNQTLQPYKKYFKIKSKIIGNLAQTNSIHNYSYYIGNYPSLSFSKIDKIINILNSI